MIDSRRTVSFTMLVFMLEPIPFGAWLALLPYVKEHLGLDKAQLALALLGMPLAVIPALNIASRAVVTYGPRRLLMWEGGHLWLSKYETMSLNQLSSG